MILINTKPKVNDLDLMNSCFILTQLDHDVLRLQIPMNDAHLVIEVDDRLS